MSASSDAQAAALRVCKEAGEITVVEYALALAELRRIQAAAHKLQEVEARSAAQPAVGQQSQCSSSDEDSYEDDDERPRLFSGAAQVVACQRYALPSMGSSRSHCLCNHTQLSIVRACLCNA